MGAGAHENQTDMHRLPLGEHVRLPAVLLVEDDPSVAQMTQVLLRHSGLRNPLVHLADGDDAVAWLSDHLVRDLAPALILLDMGLPGRSGLEILRWLRAQGVSPPVVMLTASAELSEINEAYDLGIASYLVKPVGADSVAEIVRGLPIPWALLSDDASG